MTLCLRRKRGDIFIELQGPAECLILKRNIRSEPPCWRLPKLNKKVIWTQTKIHCGTHIQWYMSSITLCLDCSLHVNIALRRQQISRQGATFFVQLIYFLIFADEYDCATKKSVACRVCGWATDQWERKSWKIISWQEKYSVGLKFKIESSFIHDNKIAILDITFDIRGKKSHRQNLVSCLFCVLAW